MCMFVINFNYRYSKDRWSLFVVCLISMVVVLFYFFVTDHFLVFFIMFELSLIPTFILILKWGYQPERFQAGLYMMLYTIVSSLPLMFRIVFLGNKFFSFYIEESVGFFDFNFSFFFYAGFMMAFLVKLPLWGVHLWLPKAHVEANVRGSIVLAGVLLKLGGYGLIKVGFILSSYFKLGFFMVAISLWRVVSVSLLCLTLVDIKQLIAYSSVVHIAFVIVGLFSYTHVGLVGAVIVIVSHGLSSPMMFMLANVIYKIRGSRNLLFHKGVVIRTRGLGLFWFSVLAANMAAPPSLNFVGELIVGAALVKIRIFLILFVGLATFLRGLYNLYLFSLTVGSYYNRFNKSCIFSSEIMVVCINVIIIFALFFCSSIIICK